METQGYLILHEPEIILNGYESRPEIQKYQEEYLEFRKAFAKFDPSMYRGISREPLESDSILYEDENEMDIDLQAKTHMYSMLREKIEAEDTYVDIDIDTDLFSCKEDALSVYELLDNPGAWEIVCVRRNNFRQTSSTLGYDIGYWGSDHFSLIADTVVIPTWHGPPEEDYEELAESLSMLNRHLLFDNTSHAAEFREFYRSKHWAETEAFMGEFCIIQVERLAPDL